MFRALKTKFLLFGAGQEQDSVPSRSPATGALTALPSLGPPRPTLATHPASTPALASASPSAFVHPAPDHTWKYVQAQGKAPEIPRRAAVLGGDRLPGRMGIPPGPVWRGWGLSRSVMPGGWGFYLALAATISAS